jgi:hypothetical protein
MSKRMWWFCIVVTIAGATFATIEWIRHALGYSTLVAPQRLHVLYGPLVLMILCIACRAAYPEVFESLERKRLTKSRPHEGQFQRPAEPDAAADSGRDADSA